MIIIIITAMGAGIFAAGIFYIGYSKGWDRGFKACRNIHEKLCDYCRREQEEGWSEEL